MAIGNKESRETKYWLRLIKDCDYLDEKLFESIFGDCEEINKILVFLSYLISNTL